MKLFSVQVERESGCGEKIAGVKERQREIKTAIETRRERVVQRDGMVERKEDSGN